MTVSNDLFGGTVSVELVEAVKAAIIPNEKADKKIERVISSWSENPLMQQYVTAWIEGDECSLLSENKIEASRIHNSDKIGFKFIGDKKVDRPFGYFGNIEKLGLVNVPVEWLHKDVLDLLDVNVANPRISWVRYNYDTKTYIDASSMNVPYLDSRGNVTRKNGMNKQIIKLMIMSQNSVTRETWKSRFLSMEYFPEYVINCTLDGKVPEFDKVTRKHVNPIKEEHALNGFFALSMTDSVFMKKSGDKFIAMGAVKKMLARMSRLVNHADAVNVGVHEAFILDDVPDALTDYFITGSCYAPDSFLERKGVVRMVNEYGVKATTMKYPNAWRKDCGDVFMFAKSSFKSDANGVAYLLAGENGHDHIFNAKKENIENFLSKHLETMDINGIQVKGYRVTMPFYVTSFYSLYGLRTPVEDSDEAVADGDTQFKSSFYTESLAAIADNPDYDLIKSITRRLKSGELIEAKQRVNLKKQELENIKYSYGTDALKAVLDEVITEASKYTKASTLLALDMMANVSITPEFYDVNYLNGLCNFIYPKGMISKITPSMLDPQLYTDVEHGRAAIDLLLNGSEDENVKWDGLFGDTHKSFTVSGKSYFIPSGEVMKQYIYPEEGSERWYVSGVGQSLLTLFLSSKNDKTNWDLKHVLHKMDMQKNLLGKNSDNFTVRGFGNKVMLPMPGLAQDEIVVLDPYYKKMDGRVVGCSKMPVLFDTAVAGFKLKTSWDESIHGKLTDDMRLAMRNAVFVNIEVMIALRNDTDGDMWRMFLIGGIPLNPGVPLHMLNWEAKYLAKESDLKLEAHVYETYGVDAIHDAVIESAENKAFVGKATNALATFGQILQLFVSRDLLDLTDATIMRCSYAMGIQDFIVSGIKHADESGSEVNLVKAADWQNCLYSEKLSDRAVARKYFKELIALYNASVSDCVDIFFSAWDELSGIAENGVTPLAARRCSNRDMITYVEVKDESYLKELDILTRSFINSSWAIRPLYSENNTVETLARFSSKFLLWEQELPQHENTVTGILFNTWRSIRDSSVKDS